MRHKKKEIKLGRTNGPRLALLKTLSISLIEHGAVTTTPAKARAVRRLVERLITRAAKSDMNAMRYVEKRLGNKKAAMQVAMELGPRFAKRPGGYTRMVKLSERKGDGAEQVRLEFVD